MITRLLILFIIAGCASSTPTPYQKEKKKEGYREKTLEDLKVTTFKGNSYTKKEQAQLYAQFRAIEICRGSENKLANIIDVFDKTVEKEYIRSNSSGWVPSYSYFGGYPYYGRYSGFGIGVGYNNVNTNSWNEKLIYPIIEVFFTCSDTILRPQVIFKELSSEQTKHLVKDIKGAIQVEHMADSSPSKKTIEMGDIILKVNDKRIEKVFELIRLFNKEKTELSVLIIREGQKVVSKLRAIDVTKEVEKAEAEIIKSVCHRKNKDHEKKLKHHFFCK